MITVALVFAGLGAAGIVVHELWLLGAFATLGRWLRYRVMCLVDPRRWCAVYWVLRTARRWCRGR